MLAAEEHWRGTPLTYEEQKALSMPMRAPAQQGAQRNQTMGPIIPFGASLLELGLGIGAMLLSAYLMDKMQPTQEQETNSWRTDPDEVEEDLYDLWRKTRTMNEKAFG